MEKVNINFKWVKPSPKNKAISEKLSSNNYRLPKLSSSIRFFLIFPPLRNKGGIVSLVLILDMFSDYSMKRVLHSTHCQSHALKLIILFVCNINTHVP